MRRFTLVLAATLLAGCSTSRSTSPLPATPSPAASAQSSPVQAANVIPGGCGSTPLHKGGVPSWLDDAGGHNNPVGVPYVLAMPAHAGGFVVGYPLRAGHPQNPNNKILWVVGAPRNGSSLEISGHPLNAATPTVHVTQPANSSPGEIYPSIVDVPKSGCWHFDLAWSGNKTSVDLMYR